jgi:hypothetical protein
LPIVVMAERISVAVGLFCAKLKAVASNSVLQGLIVLMGGPFCVDGAANRTVAIRTIRDIEERGELTRAAPVGPDLLLTAVQLGAVGLERAGDTTVDTVLPGARLPFVTPGKNGGRRRRRRLRVAHARGHLDLRRRRGDRLLRPEHGVERARRRACRVPGATGISAAAARMRQPDPRRESR